MPYGNTGRAVRAYQYGAFAPTEGWERARDQHWLRTRYWNALVEMDQERRSRREEIVVAATAPADTDEEKRAARKAAWRLPAVKEQVKDLDQVAYARQTAIRHALTAEGLYWPNTMDLERHWMVAVRKPDAPRFHRFDPREGRVAYPFSHGVAVAAVVGAMDTRARLEPMVPWSDRVGPRHAERTRLLRLRVGSEGRAPVWLALPVIMHRPLPPDGIIREISVNWRRRGTKVVWSVVVIVETATSEAPPITLSPLAVAVDLCWRRMEDGSLRAAYWLGEDGAHGETRLLASWLAAMQRVDDLRSLRDQHLDALRAALMAWIDAAPGVSEWLREARRWMQQWKAARRFAGLVFHWRANRFAGDDAGFDLVEAWRKRDKHLYEWEANLRAKLLGQRRDIYRCLAATLSRRYGRLVIETFDLRQVAAEPGNQELPAPARHQRVMVAPSEVRAALINAFERDHGKDAVLTVPAEYTTVTCPACGAIDRDWDAAANLSHTCPACGLTIDQDEAACRNLLARENLHLLVSA